MNYIAQVKVCAVSGISIFDEDMQVIDDNRGSSKGQVNCVVGISRNKFGMKTFPSLPLRQSKGSAYKGNNAVWPGGSNPLMLDAKLNNGKRKTFEVSIMLARGKEHILIGIASLKFVSVLMETEIDIPIHLIASLKAVEINTNAKTRGKAKVFGKSDYNDSFFQSNQFEMIDGIRTVKFCGGDNNRKYALDRGAFVRLKCSCLPKSGMIDVKTLDSLLDYSLPRDKSLIGLDSKTSRCNTSTSASDTTSYEQSNTHADLNDVLASQDTMHINRNRRTFKETSQTSLLEMDAASALLHTHKNNNFLLAQNRNEVLFARLKEMSLAGINFGMNVGRQCLGELTSQCTGSFEIGDATCLRNLDTIPLDIELMSQTNSTMPSAMDSPRMDEAKPILPRSKPSSIATGITSDDETSCESKINEESGKGKEKTIIELESFGTDMLGSLLGVDVAEIRGALNDRLMCGKNALSPGSTETPQAFFGDLICSKDSYLTRTTTFESSSSDDSSKDSSKKSFSCASSQLD